ncbi:MAG: 4Fe-4S ferredoxin [Candidatus Thorarchaeota archaeon]|nr:4Fe-4S ferredoxin [Candidatus Thorarchaeota archaeon]
MSNAPGGSESERLMCINVGDSRLRERGKLLLIGSCMNSRFPNIVNEFKSKNEGTAVLHICLEETHMNQAGFKIASIIRYSKLSEVSVLTVDGSPHCVQLHFVIEDIKKHFTPEIETAHYVVEKGKVLQVSPAAVKRARHLSKMSV